MALGNAEWEASPGRAGDDVPPDEAARLICLRLLANGPRTRSQLHAALRRKRVPEEIAESVLGRFAEVRLIDDAAFARAWVETRHLGRGLARSVLASELRHRGVPAEDVRAAVASLAPAQEVATARKLVARRIPATRGKPLPVRVRQLVGLLARKGYPAGLAYQVVREALDQEGADMTSTGLGLADAEIEETPEPDY